MTTLPPMNADAELSSTELGAWRGMLRVHAALLRALDAELDAAHDLPLTSYDVLIYLKHAPGKRLRMAELADSVLLSRSGVTRLVDRLEREGLLVRDACMTTAAASTPSSPARARNCSSARGPPIWPASASAS